MDMADGVTLLERTVTDTYSDEIHFTILMLAGPSDELRLDGVPDGAAKEQTKIWSDGSPSYLRSMKKEFLSDTPFGKKKRVKAEVKWYQGIPEIHGMRATKGESVRIAFTRCRITDGGRYASGQDDYHFFGSDEAYFDFHTRPWCEEFERLRSSPTVFPQD